MAFGWVCLGGRLAKKREEEPPSVLHRTALFFFFCPFSFYFLPPTYVGLCVSVSVSYNVAALRSQRQGGQFRKKGRKRKQPHPQKITPKQRQCLFCPNYSGKKQDFFTFEYNRYPQIKSMIPVFLWRIDRAISAKKNLGWSSFRMGDCEEEMSGFMAHFPYTSSCLILGVTVVMS